jgi:hypothetical protein
MAVASLAVLFMAAEEGTGEQTRTAAGESSDGEISHEQN